MDVYGSINPPPHPPSSDSFNFPIDDLLDFSNDDLFSSTTTSSSTASTSDHLPSLPSFHHHHHHHHHHSSSFHPAAPDFSPDYFAHQLSLPNDDVAELEWLSQFVDDSFADFPPNSLAAINVVQSTAASSASRGRAARSKRSRLPAVDGGGGAAWKVEGGVRSRASSPTPEGGVRRCTHCASEKTPQWRTGPMGPKTLCNACGVRYKSGRLVPEYRPAASPTFVLTQHSNSHRKVVELRRQKEMMVMRQQSGAVGRASTMYNNNQAEEQDFNVY